MATVHPRVHPLPGIARYSASVRASDHARIRRLVQPVPRTRLEIVAHGYRPGGARGHGLPSATTLWTVFSAPKTDKRATSGHVAPA
jgi:hypothetical protein